MNNTATAIMNNESLSDEYGLYDRIICSSDNTNDGNKTLFDRLKDIISISEVLRIFGACAVIASMSIFLLDGWNDVNDIQRYLKLLAQTALLTGAGIALSVMLKENKGARLFFGLSLISVVANFTVLGALIYSMFQLDGGLINYPSMVTWTALNAGTFWPVFATAVTLLALLTRFSFSIFARNIAAPLSLSFLILSSLLLLPVRGSLAISLITVTALWYAYFIAKRLSKNNKVALTNETKFALGLLFVPGLLIMARALSLYNVDGVMLLTLSGLGYFSVRSLLSSFRNASLFQNVLEKGLFFIGIFLALQIPELLPNSIYDIKSAIFSMIVVALSIDQIKRASSLNSQKFTLNMTTAGLVILNTGFALFASNALPQVIGLLTCIGLFYFAHNQLFNNGDHRVSKITSLVGIIACILSLSTHIIAVVNLGNWIMIGLIGAMLIIGGSLYERYGLSLTSSKE